MDLIQLSISAQAVAIERGMQVPAELYEFSHLPMTYFQGVPVFDAARMTDEQIADTTQRLERMTGRKHATNLFEEVTYYMEAYGRFGLRVKDICEALCASKPGVLIQLRKLEELGKVIIGEEKTRGSGGSPRKRYTWTGNRADYDTTDQLVDVGGADLVLINDNWKGQNGDSGIIHHGAAIDGLRCPCGACQWSLLMVQEEEARSAARREGGTGFTVGLEARRVRREQAAAKEKAMVLAGLAAS